MKVYMKIYNVFWQTGSGYRIYISSFFTRDKAEAERLRLVKKGRGIYKKSQLLIRVGKVR